MENALVPVTVQTAVANSPAELHSLQAPLAVWAARKLAEARSECDELHDAAVKAKRNRWNTAALSKAMHGAMDRITFYKKVVVALESGNMLFPPVPNAAVIAVRLDNNTPPVRTVKERWGTPYQEAAMKKPMAVGEGEYFNPVVRWVFLQKLVDDKGQPAGKEWLAKDLDSPVFPLAMAKPSIVDAVNAAMEMKVFDEIRMFPLERRGKGDPCLLGSIVEHRTARRLFFLISWRIDAEDI
jgi:hypothetical protein